jgi:hypothetical protein
MLRRMAIYLAYFMGREGEVGKYTGGVSQRGCTRERESQRTGEGERTSHTHTQKAGRGIDNRCGATRVGDTTLYCSRNPGKQGVFVMSEATAPYLLAHHMNTRYITHIKKSHFPVTLGWCSFQDKRWWCACHCKVSSRKKGTS